MAKNNNIGKDLADLLATHNFDVEMSSTNNQSATADEATVFKFDYVTPRGRNYGTAVIVISNDNELILFYGDNLGRGMEQEDKDDWFASDGVHLNKVGLDQYVDFILKKGLGR